MFANRPLKDLVKLENNPRTIKEIDFEKLRKSIKDNPDYFNARPIILSNRTGELVIIAGNQRYEAAVSLGLKEVPTYLLENLTESREKEIIIRDNVSNGDWDYEILANEWDSEKLDKWGVDVWQSDEDDESEDDSDSGGSSGDPSPQEGQVLIIEHEDVNKLLDVFNDLSNKGFNCKFK
ncbi:ParB N-terminal domain-containing protein [Albibacterium profundi]|uniref:ParB N-terminal domain-containing protein n=1 Tax=Albibacterium profundi TaxID=3134906 RepID=A0ABV5CF01_9SPHI